LSSRGRLRRGAGWQALLRCGVLRPSDLGRERGGGESLGLLADQCRRCPRVPFNFLKASFFAPLPSSPVSFPSESLNLFGRMTTAPAASLPPWRRHLVNSGGGGGRLLSSESFRFCVCLHSFRLHRPGCNGCSLADALPPFCSLADTLSPFCSCRCFAAIVVLMITSDGCFAAVVGRVDALPPLLCHRPLLP
jgi:hypothetical protein